MQLSGELTGPDIKAALLMLTNDPQWETGYDALIDARGITRLGINPDESAEIVGLPRLYRAQFLDSRFAILVRREADHDLARLWRYMWLKEQCEVQVYVSPDPATEWLGIPPDLYPEE